MLSQGQELHTGELVVSKNGEFGWVEGFGGRASEPWAMVRNLDGCRQSFGLDKLRRPDPEADWEVFAHVAEAASRAALSEASR
jgi:hypothetical protein